MSRISLVLLYAPADRPERFEKALTAGADTVIVDLEDAVTASRKDAARQNLEDFAALWASIGSDAPAVQVRVNAPGSQFHEEDLAAVRHLPPEFGLRVAKTQSAADVAAVQAQCPGREIHALLESALAIERAFEIASAGVASLATGEADLRSELSIPAGLAGEPGLMYSRSRVVNAAAAAGLPAPGMAVFADVADLDALEASCRAGKALGLLGRTVIHPRQIEVVRRVFTPTAAEVDAAQQIVDRVAAAAADGSGAFVLEDGTFIDIAMLRAAERTLSLG